MTLEALSQNKQMPVIFAGGVMSNTIIQQKVAHKIDGSYFAYPDFSCDNAAGVAILASRSHLTKKR
jgi:N6-L-threonylcarbamoyladenine synthase